MTSIVWANIALAVPFVLAIVGIPLWITWTRGGTRERLAVLSGRR